MLIVTGTFVHIFTAHNEVWGKVIFSEASVILSIGGRDLPTWGGVWLQREVIWAAPPPPRKANGTHSAGMLSSYQ